MAGRTLQSSGRKYRRISPRNRQQATPVNHSKRFRLSDLNSEIKEKVFNLSYNHQKLLFDLNIKYNTNFNPNKEIRQEDLNTELVEQLCNCFKVSPNDLGLAQDKIVIEQNIEHDLYIFDVKPFFKLKRKAPLLFQLYKFFVSKTPFVVCGDNKENEVYDICYYDLEMRKDDESETKSDRKLFEKAFQTLKKDKEIVKELENYDEDILEKIKEYNPSNKHLKRIKETLLQWIELNFSPLYSYPYEYYNDEEFFKKINGSNEDEDYDDEDYDDDEIKDFTDYIFFCYNDNKIVRQNIVENFQSICENHSFTTPCWIIDRKEEQTLIREEIKRFDEFSEQYYSIIELLKKI